MVKLAGYAKAGAALLATAYLAYLDAAQPVLVDGAIVEAADVITRAEWERIAGLAVSAAGVVWGVPNAGFEKIKNLVLKVGEHARPIPALVAGDGTPGASYNNEEVRRDG